MINWPYRFIIIWYWFILNMIIINLLLIRIHYMIWEFHDIPGYEWLYQFNWHTNEVKSLERYINNIMYGKWCLLKPGVWKKWRLSVWLCKNWKINTFQLWILTLLITSWNPDKWMECCHNDDNPLNNYPYNLRWWTRSSNLKDRVIHNNCNFLACSYVRRGVKGSNKEWDIIFNSIKEANIFLWKNANCWDIWKVCRWKRKTCWGYVWKYI